MTNPCTVSDVLVDASGNLLTGTKLSFRRVAPLQGVDGALVQPVFGTALAAVHTVTTHAGTAAFSIDLMPGDYEVSYQGPDGVARVGGRVPAEATSDLAGILGQATLIDSTIATQAAASAAAAAASAASISPLGLALSTRQAYRDAPPADQIAIAQAAYPAAPVPVIAAQSCVVLDMHTGLSLLAKNPTTVLKSASLTKLACALVAMNELGAEAFGDGTTVTVPDDTVYYDDILVRALDVWTLRDAVLAAMLPSNNKICNVLAFATFGAAPDPVAAMVAAMNALLTSLAISGTVYTNTFGDAPGSSATAASQAALMRHIGLADTPETALLRALASEGRETVSIGGPNARTVNLRHTVNQLEAGEYPLAPGFVGVLVGKTGHSVALDTPENTARNYNVSVIARTKTGQELAITVLDSTSDLDRYNDLNILLTMVDALYTWEGTVPRCNRHSVVRPCYFLNLQTDPIDLGPHEWIRASAATGINGSYEVYDVAANTPAVVHSPGFELLRGAAFQPKRRNWVENPDFAGISVSAGDLNDVPTFATAGSWSTAATTGDATVTFNVPGVTLADNGAGNAIIDYQISTTAGRGYAIVLPSSLTGGAVGVLVGTSAGDSTISGGTQTFNPDVGKNCFAWVETTGGTVHIRIQRLSPGSATIPEVNILDCGVLPTGWTWTGLSNTTFVLESVTTVEGLSTLSLRLVGRNTVGGNLFLNFGSPAPADVDQDWVISAFVRRHAGAADNLVMVNRLVGRNSAGTTQGEFLSGSLAGFANPAARMLATRATSVASIGDPLMVRVEYGFRWAVTAGGAFDARIHIAHPQAEPLGADALRTATTVIRNTFGNRASQRREADTLILKGLNPGRYLVEMQGASVVILNGVSLPPYEATANASGELRISLPPGVTDEATLRAVFLSPVVGGEA
jgi:D-alanyl-D-alanine carboxypeptidase